MKIYLYSKYNNTHLEKIILSFKEMLRSVESNTYLGENKMLIQIVLILFFISSCNSNLYEYLNSKGSIHTITNIPSKYCKDCRMEATIVTDDPYPYYHNPNIHAQI
ncbi:MAG TPA: hypothetical protein PKL30_17070, partial [Leptospiraceae bacterium]|nr:hypothetical protein [Leptospiraceae bacterium]